MDDGRLKGLARLVWRDAQPLKFVFETEDGTRALTYEDARLTGLPFERVIELLGRAMEGLLEFGSPAHIRALNHELEDLIELRWDIFLGPVATVRISDC